LNLPGDFKTRMEQELKEEAKAFFDSYDSDNILSLRINPLKVMGSVAVAESFESATETVMWENCGRYYLETDAPGRNPLHNAGAYYIQEASAMAPVHYLMEDYDEDPIRVLDLCAAPGGKSTQIAGYLKGKGLLVANEINPNRARILSENIERMGVKNALVTSMDPLDMPRFFENYFDRILVDAPCSGEGMFRKHPEAMEEWSLSNVDMCADRQKYILDEAAKMLKDGGKLVYSTCTFAKEEDELTVEAFLERNPSFELCDITPLGGLELVSKGQLRVWPHKVRGEGHFLAVFKKLSADEGDFERCNESTARNKEPNVQIDGKSIRRLNKEEMTIVDSELKKILKDSLHGVILSSPERLAVYKNSIYLVPEFLPGISGVKVLRTGLCLGTIERNRFEPSHALALTLERGDVKSYVDISYDEAQQYLKGMTLNSDADTLQKGYGVLFYLGCSIGFIKNANGVLKNHYPKGLRIK